MMLSTAQQEKVESNKGPSNFTRGRENQVKVSEVIPSSKDVFRGKVLVDRLLVYYSKFEGSRERAVRYAQKLLDLGHIESLTRGQTFEDSVHVYRWTDATQVSDAKQKTSDSIAIACTSPQAQQRKSTIRNDNETKAMLKISIEADNCEGAEIQARIRAKPRNTSGISKPLNGFESRTVTGVHEDSFFGNNITKTLSYINEPSVNQLDRGGLSTPVITELSPRPALSKVSEDPPTRGEVKEASLAPDKKSAVSSSARATQNHQEKSATVDGDAEENFNNLTNNHCKKRGEPSPSLRKTHLNHLCEKGNHESVTENRKVQQSKGISRTPCFKSPIATSASKAASPGTGVDEDKTVNKVASALDKKARADDAIEHVEPPGRRTVECVEEETVASKNAVLAISPRKKPLAVKREKDRCGRYGDVSKPVASTQTSEKSILQASRIYNGGNANLHNSIDQPPTLVASTQTSEKSILQSAKLYQQDVSDKKNPNRRDDALQPRQNAKPGKISLVDGVDAKAYAKANELQRINENQKKRARFFDEEPSTLSDFRECNGLDRNASELTHESTGISLHSSGHIDENLTISYKSASNGTKDSKTAPEKRQLPPSSVIPASPPLSPDCRTCEDSTSFPMKSLFWKKIVCKHSQNKSRKSFWSNLEDEVLLDQKEFEVLFRKPLPPPDSPHLKQKASRKGESGRLLKVLRLERSRQVGIRVSSVRLPVEEIHDAITNMDDEKLDIDGLQAIFDVRPTAEELDAISDTLKAHPKGILDKPEQFLLMLAMIPNLDERLECWLFAKKFPERMVELQEQLNAINEACQEVLKSNTLEKVLKTVLLLGNHMNQGTARGDADGYHLDILPKLKDVKSQEGDTSLLQYVVKIVREQLRVEGKLENEVLCSPRKDESSELPDQQLLSKAVSTSLSDIGDELEATAVELEGCKQRRLPAIVRGSTITCESETAQDKLEEFLLQATDKMREMAQLYQDTLTMADEFQSYFVPEESFETQETLSSMLTSLSTFCEEFRRQWTEEMREEAKQQISMIELKKKQRRNEIRVRTTPSALKERFMAYRRRAQTNQPKENGVKNIANAERPRRVLSITVPSEYSDYERSAETPTMRKATTKVKRCYKFESDNSRISNVTSNGYATPPRSADRWR